MTGPLHGLRVLDLGTRIAAPFCAGLLGEQGAEVIKIEQPGSGDFMREIGPFVPDGEGGDYSLFWAVEGRGRKSVTLDLRRPDGQVAFRRLAATADVVVENFRPGTLERWNVGPADLPDHLVIVRISMFGQDGPNRERPGLDRVGIGYGGLMHLTGYPDRPPVRVGVTISDYLTGVFAAQAACAALYARDARSATAAEGERGRNQPPGREPSPDARSATAAEGERGSPSLVIDASLYGGVLRILEWTLPAYDLLGTVRMREGNRLANSAPLDNYPTADGKHVCIVAGSDANFARLCAAMGREDLVQDSRFARLADRAARNDEINGIVAAWTSSLRAAEIEQRCIAADVPVATAFTAADIFADEHIAAREDLVTVDDPVAGPMRQQAPYPRFVGQDRERPSGAPRLGEHTDLVLRELGYSDDDLAAMHADGIV